MGSPEGLQWQLQTDAEGRFEFLDLLPNRGPDYSLVYVTLKLTDPDARHLVDLLAHHDTEHVIRLPRYHALRGVVRVGGQPTNGVSLAVVRGPTVALAQGGSGPAGRSWDEEPLPQTGEFAIEALEPGQAWLVANRPDLLEFEFGDLDDEEGETPELGGVQAWRVSVPHDEALELELSPRAETPLTAIHTGGAPAAGGWLRVYPAGAADDPTAPILAQAEFDERGACSLTELGRDVAYQVVAETPGQRVVAELVGGRPTQLVLPGQPLPPPARVRYRATSNGLVSDAGVQVYALDAPQQPLVDVNPARVGVIDFDAEHPGVSEEEYEQGWRVQEVPAVGEAWLELAAYGARAVRRVTLVPGQEVDLGTVVLEPRIRVPLRLVFAPDQHSVVELELRWREPETGIPLRDGESNCLAPGDTLWLGLTPGRYSVQPRWRSSRGGSWRDLPPLEVEVDSADPQPIELRWP